MELNVGTKLDSPCWEKQNKPPPHFKDIAITGDYINLLHAHFFDKHIFLSIKKNHNTKIQDMGLDTYAFLPDKTDEDEYIDAPDEKFAGINLCGGICSGGGASFRGKVYDGALRDITGITLYKELLDTKEIETISSKLHAFVGEKELGLVKGDDIVLSKGFYQQLSLNEIKDLAKWFTICKENNYVVYNWW